MAHVLDRSRNSNRIEPINIVIFHFQLGSRKVRSGSGGCRRVCEIPISIFHSLGEMICVNALLDNFIYYLPMRFVCGVRWLNVLSDE